jgi:hypothetical protein
MLKLTCTACDYWIADENDDVVNTAIVAHQAGCEKIEPEKREYRKFVLALMVGEDQVDKAIAIMKER